MSIFSPRFPTQPSPAGATVATTAFPTELAPFIKDILEKSKAQQAGASYQAYTGPQIAGYTPEETAAMEAMRAQTTGLAGTQVAQATPYFQGAKTAVEGLGQQFTGDVAQQYMNPYQQAVVDQAKRKAVEDYESKIAPGIAAQAVASQPFGGSRQAIAEGMARDSLQEQLSDIQERGLSNAYTQGRAAFEAQKTRELQQGQQFAQLGQTIPQQALRDIAVQQQLGEQDRQQEQMALDLAKGQFMEEREFPTRALQEYSAVVRGFPFQPSTYQTSTQYQATPSVANQLLQLGGAGMGAYTQFTGKPLGAAFGMASQGGGVASVIENSMGQNTQMEDLVQASFRTRYEANAKGQEIDENGQVIGELDPKEFYNRYGVGGTLRREMESILPEDFLPAETAPFRIDEVMTESATGAAAGPLPSYEEIDAMERERLMKENQMQQMFNQGGLVSIYNNEGENEQIDNSAVGMINVLRSDDVPDENIDLYNVTEPVAPATSASIDTTDMNLVDTEALELKNLYNKMLPSSDPQISEAIQRGKDIQFTNTFRDSITKEGGPYQLAKSDIINTFRDQKNPESEYNIEQEKRDRYAQAAIEGKGISKAAASLDPNASFAQNIAQMLSGVGDAVGDGRLAYNQLIEQNLQDQFNAAVGVLDVESNYASLLEKADEIDLKSNANQIAKVSNALNNYTSKSIANGNINAEMIKNSLDYKLKVKQFELQNVQNENERARILNDIAKIKNDSLYSKAIATADYLKLEETRKNNTSDEYLKAKEIDELYNYNTNKIAADLKAAGVEDYASNMTALMKRIQSGFNALYDNNGKYIGGDLADPRMLDAYNRALHEGRKAYIANIAMGRDPYEGIELLTNDIQKTGSSGLPLIIFNSITTNALGDAESFYKKNINSSQVDRILNLYNRSIDSNGKYNKQIFKDEASFNAVKNSLKKLGKI